MTLLAILAAVGAGFIVFTRVAVFLIERASPPIGTLLELGPLRFHLLDVPAAPGAPVLLLIHGASGNLRDPCFALRDSLQGRFRLIAIDRPGSGYSDRGPLEMSDPGLQADRIACALGRLGVRSCLALGHSWGAAAAAALALRHPEMVDGLILVAPATHPWPGRISRRTRLFSLPYVGRVFAELFVVPLGLGLAPHVIRAIFRPEPLSAGYGERIGALLAIRPASFVANCRDVVDFYDHVVRLAARYDDIRVPAEVVVAERDMVVSPAIHGYGLARDIPGARLTVLSGAGHMPHWTRTAEIVAAIERVAVATGDGARKRV